MFPIFGSKKGIPLHSENRQRWAIMLQGYDFEIVYNKTTDFGQADGLSRLINSQCSPDAEVVFAGATMENDVRLVLLNSIRYSPVNADDVRQEIAI